MKIAILGSGALGCLFASRLNSYAEVHLFGHWEEQMEAIRKNGLRYIAQDASEENVQLNLSEPRDYPGYFDLVLVLVKSYQTANAAIEADALLNKSKVDSKVISLQNGLGNVEILEQIIGKEWVLGGITYQAARIVVPGVVSHTGLGKTLLPPAISAAISPIFIKAGLPVEITESPLRAIWTKLAVNAAINPLTALLRVPNGELQNSTLCLTLMKRLAKEVSQVARAKGVSLLIKDPGEEAVQVVKQTAANYSSMLRDIEAGRQTEIDAICGKVTELGEELGILTPLNRSMYRMVKAAENGKTFRIEDLKKLV